MGENQQNILLSELCSASSYLDRIFKTLIPTNHLNLLVEFRTELFFFLPEDLNEKSPNDPMIDIKNGIKYFELFLKLSFSKEIKKERGPKFINMLYKHAHMLHQYIRKFGLVDIDLPRVNILSCEEKDGLPLFFLSPEAMENSEQCPILSLEEKRERKYSEFLHLGNEAIIYKQVLKAKDFFVKAINLKETPEALTLLAWVKSLLGNTEDAKKLCLKAIDIDPGYGPPYNDLGIFLMEEGSYQESLKWFEKAKKSIDYQNREYPYINSGRVYMKIKKYDQALNELQMALTLVPTHQVLHKTVERLIRKLPELARENT